MTRIERLLFIALVVLSLGFASVHAQSGQVVFLGATSGTTKALNCPTAPATPSVCVVGDGVWIWESSTTGWYQPAATIAASGVTSISVNGGAAQTGSVALTIPPPAPVSSVNGKTGAVVLTATVQ